VGLEYLHIDQAQDMKENGLKISTMTTEVYITIKIKLSSKEYGNMMNSN
jgi:hypothetical protein